MRKLLSIMVFCFAVSISAQNGFAHLQFMGIELHGSKEQIVEKLKKKGLRPSNSTDAIGWIDYANVKDWKVFLKEEQGQIKCLTLQIDMPTGLDAFSCADRLVKELKSHTNISNVTKYRQEDNIFDGYIDVYQLGAPGTVTIIYGLYQTSKSRSTNMVQAKFTDGDNHENCGFPEGRTKFYDISKIVSCAESSRMAIDNNGKTILIEANRFGKNCKILLRGNDYSKFMDLLQNKKYDSCRGDLMYLYVNNNTECYKTYDPEETIMIYTNTFQSIAEQYDNMLKEYQKRQAFKNPMAFIFRELFMTKEEQKMYDRVLPREIQDQIISGAINSVTNSGGTMWDSYNDAQKAVIHEHDNAK